MLVVGVRRTQVAAALDAGADAVLAGPLRPAELRARVRALARRRRDRLDGRAARDRHACPCRTARRRRSRDFPAASSPCLRCLASAPGRVFTKAELLRRLLAGGRLLAVESNPRTACGAPATATRPPWLDARDGLGHRLPARRAGLIFRGVHAAAIAPRKGATVLSYWSVPACALAVLAVPAPGAARLAAGLAVALVVLPFAAATGDRLRRRRRARRGAGAPGDRSRSASDRDRRRRHRRAVAIPLGRDERQPRADRRRDRLGQDRHRGADRRRARSSAATAP